MQRVFVLDNNRQPLSPCHPARARALLRLKRAAVYQRFPFTIILGDRQGGETQPVELKLDPGSKTTGVALVQQNQSGRAVIFAAEIHHRGQQVKKVLDARRAVRRSRRSRKTRYRAPRFDNRTRPAGWLLPSLMSRVYNCLTWVKRLQRLAPVGSIAVETVRFDTQLMQDAEISGVEYQQGTLAGYELREYLLEKWGRKCAYCDVQNVPLQIEHIESRARGGSNRASNLTLACEPCNQRKNSSDVGVFLAHDPVRLKRILAQAKAPLRDAAAVNATRWRLFETLKATGLSVETGSGGRTKYNRTRQEYPKGHWIDAACVGKTGEHVRLDPTQPTLQIKAVGRGNRQMCRMDRFGFPRTSAKSTKTVRGFRTGDMVRAEVLSGKKTGVYLGRVAVRSTGSFNITTATGTVQGISHKYCHRLYRADGYSYLNQISA